MEDILCKNRGFDLLRVVRAGPQLRSGDIKEVPKIFSGLGVLGDPTSRACVSQASILLVFVSSCVCVCVCV
jgi:hypothetical protein